jgi:hypothetical protein
MSVIRSCDLKYESDAYRDAPKDCPVCGERLEPPYLYWCCHRSLAFHPECFHRITLGLLRDIDELVFGKPRIKWHRLDRGRDYEWIGVAGDRELYRVFRGKWFVLNRREVNSCRNDEEGKQLCSDHFKRGAGA